MKKLLIALGVTGALFLGVLAVVAVMLSQQPDVFAVERSITVEGVEPEDVRPLLVDFREFIRWEPWSEMDPEVQLDFSDPSAGVGAWYTWEGEETGSGRMEILEVTDAGVREELEFFTPMASVAAVEINMEDTGDDVIVTWSMAQPADIGTKFAMAAMDLDGMVGKDFEKGLASLAELARDNQLERIAVEEAERLAAEAALEAEAEPEADTE